MAITNEQKQYANLAIEQFGITEEQNTVLVKSLLQPKDETIQLLESDPKGNLIINYLALKKQGNTYTRPLWQKEAGHGKKIDTPYVSIRMAKPKGKMKYDKPQGGPVPLYFTQPVIDAYNSKRHIQTLALVEGEKKALKGALCGLHIIGLNGIWGFRPKKRGDNREGEEKELLEEIKNIITVCKVQNLVYLHDGDCRDLTELTALNSGTKDLSKRPGMFAESVKQFKKAARLLKKEGLRVKSFYAHICENLPKGLDDLLIENEEEQTAIIAAFHALESSKFFQFMSLEQTKISDITEYFYLDNVERFYERHEEVIELYRFVWKGNVYQFNQEEHKVELLLHKAMANLFLIGDAFCQEFVKVKHFKGLRVEEHERVKLNKGTIELKLKRSIPEVTKSNVEDWLLKIPFFIGFENEPNFLNPQEVIRFEDSEVQFKNLARPLNYSPAEEPEPFPNIEMYLKHISQNEGDSKYEVLLDMIQMYYLHPKQKQRIICLVSREGETGKSTFIFFLKEIFGKNCAIITNSELESDFNTYVSASLICLDEGKIEEKTLQKVKSLVTAVSDRMNDKGITRQEIATHCKMVITSNYIYSMANITDEEDRFFVLDVPKPKQARDSLKEDMRKEIPQFLHFLKNRKLKFADRGAGRFAIASEHVQTNALARIRKHSKSPMYNAIYRQVHEWFELIDLAEIRVDSKQLFDAIGMESKTFDIQTMRKCLATEFQIKISKKTMWCKYPYLDYSGYEEAEIVENEQGFLLTDPDTGEQLQVTADHFLKFNSKRGKAYVFKREYFQLEID